jgi:hypothetical protein
MTVRIYKSTDASAPSLTGQTGSLTTLLDAILVNGYGSQTAAGWTINQTTTSKRGYKQNLTGANNASGMLLYVDDTGSGAGGAKEARVCGFETMSAITPTGTGQFPTSSQSALGTGQLIVRKSTTADATARAWYCIANGQTIYLFIETGDITAPYIGAYPFVFGDFKSYRASDSYAVAILGRNIENSSASVNDPLGGIGVQGASANVYNLSSSMLGHYCARSFTGAGGSKQFGKFVNTLPYGEFCTNATGVGFPSGSWISQVSTTWATTAGKGLGRSIIASFPYPNPADGSLWLSPIWIHHDGGIRGYFAGLWAPMHDRPLSTQDTYTAASGNLSGKSFIAMNIPLATTISSTADVGQVHVETSDTWT